MSIGVPLLLIFVLVEILFYLTIHSTPLWDDVLLPRFFKTDHYDRRYDFEALGLTLPVQILAGIFCTLTFLHGVRVLIQMTCGFKKSLKKAHAELSGERKDSGTLIRSLRYWLGAENPYYLRLRFGFELSEIVFQTLALVSFSEEGMSAPALAVYTSVLLVNAIALSAYGCFRPKFQRDRARLSKWVGRLQLFDITADIFYATFPLAYGFVTLGIASSKTGSVAYITTMPIIRSA